MELIKKKQPKWQDKVLAIGNLFFALTLIPILVDPNSMVSIWASVPTAFVLFIIGYTQYTLNLKFSAITVSITGII